MKRPIDPCVLVVAAGLLVGCSSETSGSIAGTTTTGQSTDSTTTTDLDLDASFPDSNDDGSVECAPQDFPLSETQELLLVPADALFMQVKAWGAGGNGEGQCTAPQDDAGLGGFSGAVFAVGLNQEIKPNDPLLVIVGQRGRAGLSNEDVVRFGFGHWGGGGLSGVFRGPDLVSATDQAKALIVAGGGGGASAPGCMPAGTGNHPNAGGMGNTMAGGPGADDVNGGAGGYEGGLGGAHVQPGKGGTGFIHASATDAVMLFSEPGTAAPPKTNDVDYAAGVGGDEQPGRVVIHFTCSEPPPM
jgi:hypothetical protein